MVTVFDGRRIRLGLNIFSIYGVSVLQISCGEAKFAPSGRDLTFEYKSQNSEKIQQADAEMSGVETESAEVSTEKNAGEIEVRDEVLPGETAIDEVKNIVSGSTPLQNKCVSASAGLTKDWIFNFDRPNNFASITLTNSPESFSITSQNSDALILDFGSGRTASIKCASRIVLNLADGNDVVSVMGVPFELQINADAGDDQITIAGSGNAMGKALNVRGGVGDDKFVYNAGPNGWGAISVNGD